MATATKLHVLDCGAMSCDLTWLLLKPGRSIRTRADKDKPVEWYPCSTHAAVVETPEGTMLWDTSCPRDWETRWVPTGLQEFFPYDQVTEESLPRLPAGPAGRHRRPARLRCPLPPAFRPRRQRARFRGAGPRLVVNDKEKEWAFGYPGEFNGAHLKADYEGLEFETVFGDTEFLPGVTFLEAPGHTPGTMAMKVDLPETGTMIFTSDALYMGDSYGPPCNPGGDRQRPVRVVRIGGEDPRHRGEV